MINFKNVEANVLGDMYMLNDELGTVIHREELIVEDLEDYKVARENGFKPQDILFEFTYDLDEVDKETYIALQKEAIRELASVLYKNKIYIY